MAEYKVAGYVKNALLWRNRNPEDMIAFNRQYFEHQIEGVEGMGLVDVYVDVTGNKETYKRPEMVRLIRDFQLGKINLIYARTSGYIAANAHELCMLLQFLFEQDKPIDFFTEDLDYQFDTILNSDDQMGQLRRMAKAYCETYADDYQEWKQKLLERIDKLNETESESK